MLSAVHSIVSLPIAFIFDGVVTIFVLACIWHFICDMVLHWNIYPQNYKRYPVIPVAIDVVGGVVIAWLIAGGSLPFLAFAAAVAGGNAPDVVHGLAEILPKKKRQRLPSWFRAYLKWHESIQRETPNVVRGLVWQIVFVLASLIIIFI